MDRRELFKTIAGVAAASGVTAKLAIVEASESTVPALAIIEMPGHISTETAHRFRENWEHATKGTAFDSVKAIVLTDGATITMLDAQGRVINKRLDGEA